MSWIKLTNIKHLEELICLSNDTLIVLFKYSTKCGLNRMVLSRFEKVTDFTSKNVAFYYLDLLKYRNISNEIVSVFNVLHKSPQILVIKRGKAIAHFSHYDIISSFNLKNYS